MGLLFKPSRGLSPSSRGQLCPPFRGVAEVETGFSVLNGSQLRQCRERTGLSTSMFAKALGLSGGGKAVVDLERGHKPISGPIARCALTMAGGWPYPTEEPSLFHSADPDNEAQLLLFFEEHF